MTQTLADAVSSATSIAVTAGMDATEAATEAQQLSAAVIEPSPTAHLVWTAALGLGPSRETFAAAATAGRRFRDTPTPLLNRLSWTNPTSARQYAAALTQVCACAAGLAPSDQKVAAAATAAASAQSSAVTPGGQPVDPMTGFTSRGAQVLDEVLDRLRAQTGRVAQARGSALDLSGIDPQTPGAFDLTGTRPPAPSGPPTPRQPLSPAPDTVAPQPVAPPPVATEPVGAAAEKEQAPAEEPEKSVDELLAELDALVGLASVKAEIHRQAAILRVDALRQKAGLKRPTITRHLIFVGNPGTGKTTVARLVAGIYKALGLLSQGQLVEVDRSELVAGYLGQTAMKTAEVADKAKGGVLFIDEAYSLNGDQYGEEAINTLVKEMEDNRDDLVVIVAGYPDPMAEFISQNPGLASRFRTTIAFDDYSDDEVEDIFEGMAAAADYDLSDGSKREFRSLLVAQDRDESFGNGRFARNVLEAAIGRHAWRLRDVEDPTLEDLRTLQGADMTDDDPADDQTGAEPDIESDEAVREDCPATGEGAADGLGETDGPQGTDADEFRTGRRTLEGEAT